MKKLKVLVNNHIVELKDKGKLWYRLRDAYGKGRAVYVFNVIGYDSFFVTDDSLTGYAYLDPFLDYAECSIMIFDDWSNALNYINSETSKPI